MQANQNRPFGGGFLLLGSWPEVLWHCLVAVCYRSRRSWRFLHSNRRLLESRTVHSLSSGRLGGKRVATLVDGFQLHRILGVLLEGLWVQRLRWETLRQVLSVEP